MTKSKKTSKTDFQVACFKWKIDHCGSDLYKVLRRTWKRIFYKQWERRTHAIQIKLVYLLPKSLEPVITIPNFKSISQKFVQYVVFLMAIRSTT